MLNLLFQLFEILGFDNLDLITSLLSNRAAIRRNVENRRTVTVKDGKRQNKTRGNKQGWQQQPNGSKDFPVNERLSYEEYPDSSKKTILM